MKISIIVKANAKSAYVKTSAGQGKNFNVGVKEPAKEGKANEAVVKLLAEHFKVSKSQISIISGLKSKHKIIKID